MKKLLVLLLFFAFQRLYSQTITKSTEVVFYYQTLSLNDLDKIKSEISNHTTFSFKEVCFNHNVIIIISDETVREPQLELFKILSVLKTNSAPELKAGDSSGLICETEVPNWMKQQSFKQ